MFQSIFTNVPANEVGMRINGIENIDGGKLVSQQQEDDGSFTLVAEFPGDPPPEATPAAAEFAWMPVARAEIGVKEGGNPRITEYFSTTTLGPQPDSVPWCSAFANFCVVRSGNKGTNSALARSWLNWGQDAGALVPGCIVVLARGGPATGHVGFYVGQDANGAIRLLGGNQHDSVNISSFPEANILGRRVLNVATAGRALDLGSIDAARRSIAQHIVDAFAAAGFGMLQQATALANAVAESNLNPMAHATAGEDSVGLFQLNRNGGRGTGHSVQELMDPDVNIGIIIAAAKSVHEFATAASLQAAVDAFVRRVEIPADIEGEVQKRLAIAQRFIA